MILQLSLREKVYNLTMESSELHRELKENVFDELDAAHRPTAHKTPVRCGFLSQEFLYGSRACTRAAAGQVSRWRAQVSCTVLLITLPRTVSGRGKCPQKRKSAELNDERLRQTGNRGSGSSWKLAVRFLLHNRRVNKISPSVEVLTGTFCLLNGLCVLQRLFIDKTWKILTLWVKIL